MVGGEGGAAIEVDGRSRVPREVAGTDRDPRGCWRLVSRLN